MIGPSGSGPSKRCDRITLVTLIVENSIDGLTHQKGTSVSGRDCIFERFPDSWGSMLKDPLPLSPFWGNSCALEEPPRFPRSFCRAVSVKLAGVSVTRVSAGCITYPLRICKLRNSKPHFRSGSVVCCFKTLSCCESRLFEISSPISLLTCLTPTSLFPSFPTTVWSC